MRSFRPFRYSQILTNNGNGQKQEISLKKIFGGSQILTINATKFAGLDVGQHPWALIVQREDLHGSSTTDMPIVGRLKMSDKQTILTQFTRKKR